MSSWWHIEFAAIGDYCHTLMLENALLSEELEKPFHCVHKVERHGGFIVASAAENYGGDCAMEALVSHYPDLTFLGIMSHRCSERYWQFEGRAGETKMQEFPPDETRTREPVCNP